MAPARVDRCTNEATGEVSETTWGVVAAAGGDATESTTTALSGTQMSRADLVAQMQSLQMSQQQLTEAASQVAPVTVFATSVEAGEEEEEEL